MNRWQRAAAMVGVVLVLFGVERMLTPFSTRVILNPKALRAATRVEPCGITLSEATKAPSVRTDEIVLTALGQQAKASSEAARDAALQEVAANRRLYAGTYSTIPSPDIPQVLPDDAFDHVTVTTFTLSPCESAARRRVASAGVLIGLAVVGVLAAVVLMRDGRQRLPNNPVEASPHR